MIFNLSNVARGLGQKQLSNLTFVAVCAMVAATGCGDDGTSTLPVTGGAGAATGAAGAATGAAGTTGVAGAATGVAGATTGGVAGATTGGAAGATVGGAAGATTGGVAGATTGGAAGATTGGAAPTLTMVYDTVYITNCAVCHGMAPNPNTNGNLGNVKGGKDAFFNLLVNKPAQGPQCMGKGMYIVPGSPATSLLVQKVSSAPPCGVEMPVGGMLSPEDAKMLTDWIQAGALNN